MTSLAMIGVAFQEQRRHTRPCPECRGTGYLTIEVREPTTLYATEYPINSEVVAYKTIPCWRCKARGVLEED